MKKPGKVDAPQEAMNISIGRASGPEDLQAVRCLFQEYAESLGFDLCFQDFAQELATLPGKYSPSTGCLLLAKVNGEVAGCIALRPLQDDVCEMKRLYVRDMYRGVGLGRELAERAVLEARQLAYRSIGLDTVPSVMGSAVGLYSSLGFQEIAPYCLNPIEGAKFMELKL